MNTPASDTEAPSQLAVQLPRGPHPDTWRDPRAMFTTPNRQWIAVYCHRHSAAALYNVGAGIWLIWTPIAVEEFVMSLVDRGVVDRDTVTAWLAAIQPPSAVTH